MFPWQSKCSLDNQNVPQLSLWCWQVFASLSIWNPKFSLFGHRDIIHTESCFLRQDGSLPICVQKFFFHNCEFCQLWYCTPEIALRSVLSIPSAILRPLGLMLAPEQQIHIKQTEIKAFWINRTSGRRDFLKPGKKCFSCKKQAFLLFP